MLTETKPSSVLLSWLQNCESADDIVRTNAEKIESLRKKLATLERQHSVTESAQLILMQVLIGWKQNDPGKDGPCYHFINLNGKRVIVDELVLPADVQMAQESTIRRVSLSDVLHRSCPACGPEHLLPVIEEYHQTD